MAKKPDMTMILGIGKKKKPDEAPPEPPDVGGDTEPDPEDPNEALEASLPEETPGGGGGGGDLTPDMLDYHDGTQSCGNCTMFTAPSTCSRWPDPVEEAGWCKGFNPNVGEAAAAAGPPAGPPGGAPV